MSSWIQIPFLRKEDLCGRLATVSVNGLRPYEDKLEVPGNAGSFPQSRLKLAPFHVSFEFRDRAPC